MRGEADRSRLQLFMTGLGDRVGGEGFIYLTGGATAVLFGWPTATIDIDLKAELEPAGLFEAMATLEEDITTPTPRRSPNCCAATTATREG